MSHTKGPWRIERVENLPAECADDVIRYCYPGLRIKGDTGIAAIWNDTKQTRANARLIAAAPQLLEALKGTMTVLRNLRDHCQPEWDSIVTAELLNAWDANKAALAQAEGKE